MSEDRGPVPDPVALRAAVEAVGQQHGLTVELAVSAYLRASQVSTPDTEGERWTLHRIRRLDGPWGNWLLGEPPPDIKGFEFERVEVVRASPGDVEGGETAEETAARYWHTIQVYADALDDIAEGRVPGAHLMKERARSVLARGTGEEEE